MKSEFISRIAGTTISKLLLFVIFAFVSALLISACAGKSLSQSSAGIFSSQKAAVVVQELTAKLAATIFLAEIEGEEDALPAIVTATRLNVRNGPGVSYRRVGIVTRNDELQVIGQTLNCQWLQVITPSRLVGWVASSFVSHDWTCDEAAVVTPLPSTSATRAPTKTTMVGVQSTLLGVDTPTETPTLVGEDTPTATPTFNFIRGNYTPETPTETPTLVGADTPTDTPPPVSPTAPSLVGTPVLEGTEEPTATEEAEETEEAEATPGPEATDEPTATEVSEETPEPVATPEPEVTEEPEATPEPEATEEPAATPEPEETDEPEETED